MSLHTRHLSRYEVGDNDAGNAPTNSKELARQQAIKQIGRRRRFRIEAVSSAIGMVILAVIWAISEYHNAGGWPTQGFSQSSGIHDVWNFWIIYPLIAWVLIMSARGWSVYAHKPISESEINREIERQAGTR
jgi:H+/Cl- antiporter ClcA